MNIQAVSNVPAEYPTDFDYDETKCEIRIGNGRFGPVAPEIWKFEVSGLKVVPSWLSYRMKARGGKKSSPLDEIRPERWTPRLTDEFLELLWVLESTVAMEPKLTNILNVAVESECFMASDLPTPTPAEREPLVTGALSADLFSLTEIEDDPASDEM
jgi:Type ISP C-terminal specificity domain